MSLGAVLIAVAAAGLTDQQLGEVGFVDRVGRQVAIPIGVQTEDGSPAHLPRGPLLLVPADYGCANLCGLSLDGVAEGLKPLDIRPAVVVASFDARDGPREAAEARRALDQRHPGQVAENWQFWTGTTSAVASLFDSIGFRYVYDDKRGQFAHEAGLLVLDEEHRIRRVLTGIRFPPGALRVALEGGSSAGLAERVRLLCYDYDPATGRYTLSVLKLLRLACALTVLAIGIWLWRVHHRRRSS